MTPRIPARMRARNWAIPLIAVAACSKEPLAPASQDPAQVPAIDLALSGRWLTVAQGGTDSIRVSLTRTNYSGAITLTVEGLPAGVNAVVTPASLSNQTTSTLIITAAESAAAQWSSVTIRARGVGVAEKTAPLDLSITSSAVTGTSAPRGQIAFATPGGGDGSMTIYLANADGTSLQTVFSRPGDGYPVFFELDSWNRLAWSPDGSKIAFEWGRGALFVANLDGSGVGMISQPGSTDTWTSAPSWSPDGTRIAFASFTWYWLDQGTGIYVAPPDIYAGGQMRGFTRLTTDNDWWPSWSPDGTQIAFARYSRSYFLNPLSTMPAGTNPARSDIFVMNADGSGVRRLTNNGWPVSGLTWSPDGSKIAFSADSAGCQAILVMNADGSGITRLTGCGVAAHNPSWSPDGGKIVFEQNFNIYTINADGSGVLALSAGVPGVNPAWSPRK